MDILVIIKFSYPLRTRRKLLLHALMAPLLLEGCHLDYVMLLPPSKGMMSMFSDLVEEAVEIFMDDFSVYGSNFEHCLKNLETVLQRCQEKNLSLN